MSRGRGIDQYGEKTGIATPDQIKKANQVLDPIKISLFDHGVVLPTKQELDDIEALRKLNARNAEIMRNLSDKISTIEADRQRLENRVEYLNPMFYCPRLQTKITLYDCNKGAFNAYCSQFNGVNCSIRIMEIKNFFRLP